MIYDITSIHQSKIMQNIYSTLKNIPELTTVEIKPDADEDLVSLPETVLPIVFVGLPSTALDPIFDSGIYRKVIAFKAELSFPLVFFANELNDPTGALFWWQNKIMTEFYKDVTRGGLVETTKVIQAPGVTLVDPPHVGFAVEINVNYDIDGE